MMRLPHHRAFDYQSVRRELHATSWKFMRGVCRGCGCDLWLFLPAASPLPSLPSQDELLRVRPAGWAMGDRGGGADGEMAVRAEDGLRRLIGACRAP